MIMMGNGFKAFRCGRLVRYLHRPRQKCLLFLIAASFLWSGCAETETVPTTAVPEINLADRLMPADASVADNNVNRNLAVIRRGLRKDTLTLVAPVSVRASLPGASGNLTLEGLATPVFNIGDGVEMKLFLIRSGVRRPIGHRFFDSGRRAEDRDWIPIAFPVDLHAGDQLEIDVSAGPQGDLVADWLALSELRFVHRETAP